METVSKRIAKLLYEKRIKQRELSDNTGITECTISRYVSGQRIPTVKNLVRIAKALNTTTDYLVGLKED